MKYRALRIISTIYKILAWIVLVLGVLGVCAYSALIATGAGAFLGQGVWRGQRLPEGQGLAGAIVGAGIAFVGGLLTVGFYTLLLFAVSEGIQVMLDIEENTRRMVEAFGEK